MNESQSGNQRLLARARPASPGGMPAILAPVAALIILAGSVASLAVQSQSVSAASRQASHSRTVVTTFRLHVAGSPDPRTTFWVSYGPLEGKWGLVRLHSAGNGLETATRVLPATGRTTFTYLAGQGTVHTRLGPAPGMPIVTIKAVGPTTPERIARTSIQWSPPVG